MFRFDSSFLSNYNSLNINLIASTNFIISIFFYIQFSLFTLIIMKLGIIASLL